MLLAASDETAVSHEKEIDFAKLYPLLPLPNAVLFPRAVLPLHIFEERYRTLTRDALDGSRLIAMGLLKPGYETRYDTKDVSVHSTVCLGQILREERLSDGRYNFLLQGIVRAKVIRENHDRSYRQAILQPQCPDVVAAAQETDCLQTIGRMLSEPPLKDLAKDSGWLELFKCADICLSDLLDLLASVMFCTPEEKQAFLAEPRVQPRFDKLCRVISQMRADLIEEQRARPKRPRSWPPSCSEN